MHRNIPELLVFFVWYFPTVRCYFSDYRSYYIYYYCQEEMVLVIIKVLSNVPQFKMLERYGVLIKTPWILHGQNKFYKSLKPGPILCSLKRLKPSFSLVNISTPNGSLIKKVFLSTCLININNVLWNISKLVEPQISGLRLFQFVMTQGEKFLKQVIKTIWVSVTKTHLFLK